MSNRTRSAKRPAKVPPTAAPEPTPAKQDGASVFREHFVKAAVPAIVTGLLALFVTSTVYLYNAKKNMRDLQTPVQKALAEDATELELSRQFSRRAQDAVDRNNAALMKYLTKHPLYKRGYFANAEVRKEALTTAVLAVQRANTDTGSVAAYAQQATLLPQTYKTAVFDSLRLDIAVWNALAALAQANTPADEQNSLDALWNRWGELSGAWSSFGESHAVAAASIQKKQLEEKQLYENHLADFSAAMRMLWLATTGASVAGIGLLAILGFIFWPKLGR